MKKSPLIMARGGGEAHGRPNSTEAIRASAKYNPDIIELDFRKSKEGILYCFHGSIPFGVMGAFFLQFFSFKTIQKLIKVEPLALIFHSPNIKSVKNSLVAV